MIIYINVKWNETADNVTYMLSQNTASQQAQLPTLEQVKSLLLIHSKARL